ncbi:MAG: ISNCY family transposase, partial [Planctomycetales bacterium]|nr:ISNCY family transposase [Planctomycetales bacterium]
MRESIPEQGRLDCTSVGNLPLNLNCRDELIPIIAALKHLYSDRARCSQIMKLIESDVNGTASKNHGRRGIGHWQILVLAAVRLGCDFDYDHLHNLAEEHLTLRRIMGIGDWEEVRFSRTQIRDNLCKLSASTVESISHVVVDAGHEIVPEAIKRQRADSTVVETNIHYPTESSLIFDGVRKIIELCVRLHEEYDITGWRQHAHLVKQVKKSNRNIARIVARKGGGYKERLKSEYSTLLNRAGTVIQRAKETCEIMESDFELPLQTIGLLASIRNFISLTLQVCNTATRRVLNDENVPNKDKLFSIFEPHTQLYRRGKAGVPNQYGRLVLFFEDGAGFITHHHVMPRDAQDVDVATEQTMALQKRMDGQVEAVSFDRGFHSPANQAELPNIVPNVCLPMPG